MASVTEAGTYVVVEVDVTSKVAPVPVPPVEDTLDPEGSVVRVSVVGVDLPAVISPPATSFDTVSTLTVPATPTVTTSPTT